MAYIPFPTDACQGRADARPALFALTALRGAYGRLSCAYLRDQAPISACPTTMCRVVGFEGATSAAMDWVVGHNNM